MKYKICLTNKNPDDDENQIISSEKDKDIQESAQGSNIGSNDNSVMVQDTNRIQMTNYKQKIIKSRF